MAVLLLVEEVAVLKGNQPVPFRKYIRKYSAILNILRVVVSGPPHRRV